MKKTTFSTFASIIAMLLIAFSFHACNKSASSTQNETLAAAAPTASMLIMPAAGNCYDATVELTAGQSIDAGTVKITSDATNLYVTFSTKNGYMIKEAHAWAGICGTTPTNNGGNVAPGKFPGKFTAPTDPTTETQATITLPLNSIAKSAEGCICVAAHASLVKYNGDGTVSETQTGWGHGENPFTGNQWGWTVGPICPKPCTPPPTSCYGADETATGNGELFANGKGNNWFEFSTYPQPNGGGVPLVTGSKNIVIGNINFSPVVDGKTNITITLNADCARLAPGDETVKIQPSDISPMNWLAPGSFSIKGNSLTVTGVPYAPYYAIHLTIQRLLDCTTMNPKCN